MGYCPRCGENSPYGQQNEAAAGRPPARLRIARDTRVVDLGEVPDGSVIWYGGSRFRVCRRDGATTLELVG